MKVEPLKNKWTEDYFDAFKKDVKAAIEYLKQQFDNGISYDCEDIDKAIADSFPDIENDKNI